MEDQILPQKMVAGGEAGSQSPISGPDPEPMAIKQLIADHHEAIFRYAFRLSGNRDDAEDLSQQTFMVAHQKRHQIREPGKARGWLYAVLRSCYLKSQRKQRPASVAGMELDVNDIPQTCPNEDNVDRELLQAAIDELADEFKVVLLMFYFESCSYKEIAEKLELPVGTVMSRLSRAKSRLRGRLLTSDINVN